MLYYLCVSVSLSDAGAGIDCVPWEGLAVVRGGGGGLWFVQSATHWSLGMWSVSGTDGRLTAALRSNGFGGQLGMCGLGFD